MPPQDIIIIPIVVGCGLLFPYAYYDDFVKSKILKGPLRLDKTCRRVCGRVEIASGFVITNLTATSPPRAIVIQEVGIIMFIRGRERERERANNECKLQGAGLSFPDADALLSLSTPSCTRHDSINLQTSLGDDNYSVVTTIFAGVIVINRYYYYYYLLLPTRLLFFEGVGV